MPQHVGRGHDADGDAVVVDNGGRDDVVRVQQGGDLLKRRVAPGDRFGWTISARLRPTVLFANLAEAVAE
ncbi:hypothetical protein ABZ590_39040, partial [Streptomyces hirsutus]